MSGFKLIRSTLNGDSPKGSAMAVSHRRWGSSDRIGVSVVIDCSSSMAGGPIELVNNEMAEGFGFLQKDVIASQKADIQVIAAGGVARVIQDYTSPRDAQIPRFVADGGTPLYQGALLAVEGLNQHERDCQAAGVRSFASVLVILTDGQPDNVPPIQVAATKAIASISSKCCVVPIVTPSGNRNVLEALCGTKAFVAGQGELSRLFRSIFKTVSVVSSMQPSQVSVGMIRGLITKG